MAEAASNEMSMEERMEELRKITKRGNIEELRANERLLGPCQRVADDPKYRAVFQDPTLAHYVIRRIYLSERDEMILYFMNHCRLDKNQADRLFMMLVYGLFYVNQSLKWVKDENWYEMQMMINRFMFGGLKELT